MPCSLLTLHAYRSWMPDHSRGYVKQGQILPRDAREAQRYHDRSEQPAVIFDVAMLSLLHSGTLDIATQRGWRVHAVFGEPTHVHIIVSWKDATRPLKVRRLLANLPSKFLGEWSGQPGRRWFARRPSFKPIRDRDHFEHVVGAYCEKHRFMRWREGEPAPPPLSELLARGREG